PDDRPRQPAAVRTRVGEQAAERDTLSRHVHVATLPGCPTPCPHILAGARCASSTPCGRSCRALDNAATSAARPAPCAATRTARRDRQASAVRASRAPCVA